jgi:hypothetical protein
MSNETDDNIPHKNSTLESQDRFNNTPRDTDVNLPKSRLSSASKKNKEQQPTFVNESSNDSRIKSPSISRQNTNQFNDNKLTNENQSPLTPSNNEEQSTLTNRSRSSFPANEPSNDGPTTTNNHSLSLHDEQNSPNVSTDNKNQEGSHEQTTNITYFSSYLVTFF